MNIVLYQPEIPPNTGAIARICAATRSPLHLVAPLGFKIDDKHLKRAGLDYWEYVEVLLHDSWQDFLARYGSRRLLFFSKKAKHPYTEARFKEDDYLVFGPEKGSAALTLPTLHPSSSMRRSGNWGGFKERENPKELTLSSKL